MPTEVGVVGTGYVGLTTAAGLARLGHCVTGVDVDAQLVAALRNGVVELREPGLAELVHDGIACGRLQFSTQLRDLADAEIVFVAVPTPTGAAGLADVRAVDEVVTALAQVVRPGSVVVTKSTVPVGTAARLQAGLAGTGLTVVGNPEFLREAHAVDDFLHPDRIVVGAQCDAAADRVAALYAGLPAPTIRTGFESAELAKYASNAFLALKISYVNELAELCEAVHANIGDVAAGLGADPRIGPHFLRPGPGWGGSCLPKDTSALLGTGREHGLELAVTASAVQVNDRQVARTVAKVRAAVPLRDARIGLLGLAFKAGTADCRASPALRVAGALLDAGARVRAYDPAVTADCALPPGLDIVADPYAAAQDAAALVVLTEWPEFARLGWSRIRGELAGRTVVDTRNVVDAAAVADAGLTLVRNGIE